MPRAAIRIVIAAAIALEGSAHASGSSLLTSLSGTWNDVEGFVTLGQCASAPLANDNYRCNPANLADVREPRFDAVGFLSGTDSALGLANTFSSQQIDSSSINQLFTNYNYSEAILNTQTLYAHPGWMLGVSPARAQAMFQVHNPSLPLGSLSLREEVNVFVAGAYAFHFGAFEASLGLKVTGLGRNETLAEASLVDFASMPASSLLQTQTMYGVFGDLGTVVRFHDALAASLLFQDIGAWVKGVDLTPNYLFIYQDRNPRTTLSLSWTPRVFSGNMQLGVAEILFLEQNNSWPDQLLGTVSYYVGPLKILSAFRPGLLRTGLSLRFSDFEASVAQEWLNTIEPGRQNQPRFIIGGAVGL